MTAMVPSRANHERIGSLSLSVCETAPFRTVAAMQACNRVDVVAGDSDIIPRRELGNAASFRKRVVRYCHGLLMRPFLSGEDCLRHLRGEIPCRDQAERHSVYGVDNRCHLYITEIAKFIVKYCKQRKIWKMTCEDVAIYCISKMRYPTSIFTGGQRTVLMPTD